MVQPKNEGYLGNNLIKRAGVETKYTKDEIENLVSSNVVKLT